ncbi:MAG TPA: hypothetical protein VGM88_18555 [Kofleriaceae bacterium]|jgi:hypothetical protein
MMRRACHALLILAAACGDDGNATSDGGADAAADAPAVQPPLTNATALTCPDPQALPFKVDGWGFHSMTNATLAAQNPRVKNEASDTIGLADGSKLANIYMADTDAVAGGQIDYQGDAARTTHTGGLFEKPLVNEFVSLWYYDGSAWQTVGRAETDGTTARWDLPATGYTSPNGATLYSVLEADGSCAEHSDTLLPAGEKVVVMDIDGTLTLSDNEFLMEVTDDTYVPQPMVMAAAMAQAWAAKHYTVVYLTARTHVFRPETRQWLDTQGFPPGPVITENGGETADAYKTIWLQRITTDLGWVVEAAYGNADTDITAYNNVGIPKDHTFIIGPLAGSEGTVGIANDDYTSHIASFIAAEPDNN